MNAWRTSRKYQDFAVSKKPRPVTPLPILTDADADGSDAEGFH
jgi:hypothetical protein